MFIHVPSTIFKVKQKENQDSREMPLKFLKKSRHYNVTSKSLFVISVHHLLDTSTTVDCTLSSESKGQECLDNVCQRLSISQPELFGLRFIVKGKEDELKWIDLDRPLSRQLEKYAARPKIFLRVLHYVTTGVKHLSDEVSRYYYFLQLKNDVVEERIACDVRTAILLALYCRQAEYDIYQRDKHTKDYLRTRLILPKSLMHDGFDESLIDEVQQLNPTIQHLSQSQAEEMYIKCCQRLDGYGEERFSAKDSLGNDIQLGLTINGIVVNSQIGRQYYPWKDFLMVVNAKRSINIEQKKDELIYTVASFTLPDADTARYIWKLCVTQHIFFKSYVDEETESENGVHHPDSIQNFAQDFGESREDLLLEQQRAIYNPECQIIGPCGGGAVGVQNSIMSSNISLDTSSQHQQARTPNQSWANIPQEYASSTNCSFTNMVIDPLDNRVQSTSCLDLSNNNFTHERERLKAMLPTYRPAPDYETAVSQKYRASSNEVHNINHQAIASALRVTSSGAMLSPDPNFYSGSQPDVHNMSTITTDNILHHLAPHRYPDVTQTAQSNAIQNHTNLNNIYTNIDLAQRLQMMRTKPPPPYPANRLSSSSTPDLAVANHRTLLGYRAYVSGSSPDLVSNRNLLSNQYQSILYPYMNQIGHSQPYLAHGTFENLNMIEEQPSLVLPLTTPTQQPPSPIQPTPSQQIYRPQKFQEVNGGALQRSVMNGSIEPIYENVPLPHCYTSENTTEMRNRTSSIQSAPGGIHQGTPIAQIHSEIDGITLNMQCLHTSSNRNGGLPLLETTNDGLIQMNKPQTPKLLSTQPQQINQENHVSCSPIAPPRKANLLKTTSDILPHPSKQLCDDHCITSHSSSQSYLNSTQTTQNSTLDSMNTSMASSATKEKRKKRWNILGRSKNSAEKERKSATLGRDKSKNQVKVELSQEEMNLRHRWSTGLPKLQPISASYSKDKLCQILDAKLNDSQLFMEFERIPKRRESARYECALMEENMRKNSDPNFLPYDDNRVRITPSMENRHGYVNASHISATVGTKQRFYIVAQSPQIDLMKGMFWQCVWEADVYLIVQLSEDLNYIPPDTNHRLEFGQFQVYQEFSQTTDRCITSKLRLYHVQSRRYRSVWHLNYTDWAEQNCPRDVNHFLDFLEELNSVRMASVNEVPPGHNTNPPVLLHCLEGGGRSGVALTADLLLYTLDHNEDLDIPRVIGQLRHQRDSIIPSLAQYKFIYALLITYLKRTRLI